MTVRDWSGHRHWHTLFDEICNRRGHYDNAVLASELCRQSGRGSKEDFEAAKKKLRNWRRGKRVPLRRNFQILSDLLQIATDAELVPVWYRLYAAAHERAYPQRGAAPADAEGVDGSLRERRWRGAGRREIAAAAGIFIGGILIAATAFERHPENLGLPVVGYNAQMNLIVGETKLIHGEYDQCDGPPPEWEAVLPRIPDTDLGVFGDGGLAAKMVNDCGREMVVRAVRFTAVKPGIEEVVLLGDYMRLVVTPVEQLRSENTTPQTERGKADGPEAE
ncbi:hypothetical protein [Nitratireductor pacificus]|uniref:Uncharacterized protein n=1 Tax=Nitratireductor pacificus pht-3B TaxID=391937 RepID=K2N994_9HYPH|nr:hypothetical protein [Nitratireductor pacificus]EKF20683.1 hypothetical protein NA2_02824 [Nitratireductor pacificus pht-3B]